MTDPEQPLIIPAADLAKLEALRMHPTAAIYMFDPNWREGSDESVEPELWRDDAYWVPGDSVASELARRRSEEHHAKRALAAGYTDGSFATAFATTPAIVSVLDAGEHGQRTCLSYEFILEDDFLEVVQIPLDVELDPAKGVGYAVDPETLPPDAPGMTFYRTLKEGYDRGR